MILCPQAMHLTELSSSHSGSRGRRSRSTGLGHDTYNTRSLPRHFKLSTHQQGAAQSYYDATKDMLYVSKSIALICHLPYVHAACKFLTGLHRWELLVITWKIQVSWDVMLGHWVSGFWHIKGSHLLHLEWFRSSSAWLLKMKSLQSFETSGTTNPPAQCHIMEDMNP
jgi:hypothetical protein